MFRLLLPMIIIFRLSLYNKTLATRGHGSPWYHFDHGFRTRLRTRHFLLNVQQPFNFTSGGFLDLSLPSFTGVMSKTYSSIAILRQMYER